MQITPSMRRRGLAFALMGGVALGAVPFLPPMHSAQAALPGIAVDARPQGFADLVAQVSPAVVRISVLEAADPVPREFRGTPLEKLAPGHGDPRGEKRVMGQGSGFVIDPAGYIVTNFHVAGKAEKIRVKLSDGTELDAKLIGSDSRTDLALLKVESAKPLPAVAFASQAQPRVGDWVLAVGNPFGLGASVTSGIVSARGRDLGAGPYDDFLQTDAAINPGNSGGPLFDTEGHVVGVNTAIVSPSGGSVGIGFAIPADLASKVVTELREHGAVKRGWLGVELAPVEGDSGIRVVGVERGSPASRAGLRPGDVIVEADGGALADSKALVRKVADHAPGSAMALAVKRAAATLDLQVTLGDQPT
jgi:serine protease Do